MNLTRADLARLRRETVTKLAKFREKTMAPTRVDGVLMTPAITAPGRKTYTWAGPDGRYYAEWDDDRPRVPVVKIG